MSLDQDVVDWLDTHEQTLYMNGESTVCRDPDGGLLRYSKAIRAVLMLHTPMPWYEECVAHKESDESGDYWETHFYVGADGLAACEESRQPDVCRGCTPDGADDDTVPCVPFPCDTVRAIHDALDVRFSQVGEGDTRG